MKIIFITSTRLGDGILSTGVIPHFRAQYPNAEFTVACGPLVSGIFTAAPGVTRVIALKKERYNGHWFKLAREVMFTTDGIFL